MHRTTLAIGVPLSGNYLAPEWALGFSILTYPMGCSRFLTSMRGLPTDEARNTIVRKALTQNTEYLFFVDEDTVPPPDGLVQLMQTLSTAEDDVMVCGGIYTTKTDVAEPMVFMEYGGGSFWKWKYKDVFPCWGLGTGCMLIKTAVFNKIPEPWFKTIRTREEAEPELLIADESLFEMSEDMYFCEKLHRHGFKMLAHGGVLPIHCGPNSRYYTLHNHSYPIKGVPAHELWYSKYRQ